MLPRLRIIQVGDVHLPGAVRGERSLDEKDRRFPPGMRNVISTHPTKNVFQQIYRLLQTEDFAAILFMGDLTDIGNLAGYSSCATYIARALQLGSQGELTNTPIGIVPGNHDINRELAKKVGLTPKFAPLVAALASVGLPTLPVARPIWLDVGENSAKAKIALLNSCWGCGAQEFIPQEFRPDVFTAIDQALARGEPERTTRAYYDRQFDTPAFSHQTIQEFSKVAAELAGAEILIACAHHNLLPQRKSRLAPYTELINSGALRGVLCELQRPVIYLHGHIHDDPIEIIATPDSAPLICISAPEATSGFNVLNFAFTPTGVPLSCNIFKWRFDDSGVLAQRERLPISLLGQRRRSHDRTLVQLYAMLLNSGELYWADLVRLSSTIYTQNPEAQLEEGLELLATDGRVIIENHEMPRASWIVGAKV
jgi:hypothetical protein